MANGETGKDYYGEGDDGWSDMIDNGAEIRNKTKEVEEAITEAEEFIERFDPSSDDNVAEANRKREELENLQETDFYEDIDEKLQMRIKEIIDDLTLTDPTDPTDDEE